MDLLAVFGLVSVYLCLFCLGLFISLVVYFVWAFVSGALPVAILWVNSVVITGSLRYGFDWLLTFVLGFGSVVCICYLGLVVLVVGGFGGCDRCVVCSLLIG